MKAEERKKQIMDAALKAFARHGYERTSIAVICQEAGIARPTLYQYFKDKRSLFRELLEGHLLDLHEKIHARHEARKGPEILTPQETMRSLHRELMEEFAANPDLFTIFLKEAKARNAETDDIVKGIMQGMMRELMNEMRALPGAAAISDQDLEFTVLYMIGGMMQTVEYYLFDSMGKLSPRDLGDKISSLEARIRGI
jgi:TetR/AcrR family transcriptional regulator, fatty acid metabolism regulator protein